MNMEEVKAMARGMGIIPGKKRKAQLILEIQEREGNIPCFGTSRVETCGEDGCLWRKDCLAVHKKALKGGVSWGRGDC